MRAHLGARAPKEAVINGARYSMRLFRSSNGRHVRTFYPVFLGPADGNGGGNDGNGNGGVTTVVKGNELAWQSDRWSEVDDVAFSRL